MIETPRAKPGPHWPDATQENHPARQLALKSWPWALERLEKSHKLLDRHPRAPGRSAATSCLFGAVWWQDAFWFSTGPRTRKAKNNRPPTLTA